nr:MAG TPA: hypothetical protein [Caudoviricetes sp.]
MVNRDFRRIKRTTRLSHLLERRLLFTRLL